MPNVCFFLMLGGLVLWKRRPYYSLSSKLYPFLFLWLPQNKLINYRKDALPYSINSLEINPLSSKEITNILPPFQDSLSSSFNSNGGSEGKG